MKNWNKPEVEELDVRCTEATGWDTFSEAIFDPSPYNTGKPTLS